jgi:hypothetical protein
MSNITLDTTEIENAKHTIANDLKKTIKILNRSAGFGYNAEDKNKFDDYMKIAQGKGKSIKEIKESLLSGSKEFQKAMQMLLEIATGDDEQNFFEKHDQALNLMTKSVIECWDFYSLDTQEFLREFALKISEYNKSIKNPFMDVYSVNEGLITPEERNIIKEKVKQHEKTLQKFINSVTGTINWKNCETDLGRKLFKIKEQIIMSGEPLLTLAEFDGYLEQQIENQ